jgi:predicted transport protein
MEFVKLERIWLKSDSSLNEKWVQDRIAEDPSIIGLGDLDLRDKERTQPKAGRLDLLLEDTDSGRRYEVEVQLGPTDESHIIRTVEYWDVERKRYPQYDHCAVIVAEDITSRFLNVINPFNGSIPLIAIQMKALKIGESVALDFTTVVDELVRGPEDPPPQSTDRAYWEARGSKETVALADDLLKMIHAFAPDLELKYNKFYIGLAKDGQPNNFVVFRAKKKNLRAEIRLKQSDEIQAKLEEAGLDAMDYDKRWGRYRVRLTKADVDEKTRLLTDLMRMSFEQYGA